MDARRENICYVSCFIQVCSCGCYYWCDGEEGHIKQHKHPIHHHYLCPCYMAVFLSFFPNQMNDHTPAVTARRQIDCCHPSSSSRIPLTLHPPSLYASLSIVRLIILIEFCSRWWWCDYLIEFDKDEMSSSSIINHYR